jgi:hypothetical protein
VWLLLWWEEEGVETRSLGDWVVERACVEEDMVEKAREETAWARGDEEASGTLLGDGWSAMSDADIEGPVNACVFETKKGVI